MEKPDIRATEVRVQHKTPNLHRHSVILDVTAADQDGKHYETEIQRGDAGANPKRERYHLSLMVTSSLEKTRRFHGLAEIGCDFHHRKRCPKEKQTAVPHRTVNQAGDEMFAFDDGENIIYVNGAYSDVNTDIGKLIHDIKSKEAKRYIIRKMPKQLRI